MYNPLLLVLLTYPLHASSFTFSTRESQEKVPTAIEVAADMYPGWNLGNTIEPRPSYRSPRSRRFSAGQASKTTQAIIHLVKEQGFRSVRIPCSWFVHSNADHIIDTKWLRVGCKEVVDYCMKDSLYVILNDHYDNHWIEKSFADRTESSLSKNCTILPYLWKQIANHFRHYDHRLLFARMNEPDAAGDSSKDKEGHIKTLIRYEQAFVAPVSAGSPAGNNATPFSSSIRHPPASTTPTSTMSCPTTILPMPSCSRSIPTLPTTLPQFPRVLPRGPSFLSFRREAFTLSMAINIT